MCRRLANKGLNTFHGMIGYCMKDACRDHFEIVTILASTTSTWGWSTMHCMGKRRKKKNHSDDTKSRGVCFHVEKF